MSADGWFCIVLLIGVLIALMKNWASPDVLFVGVAMLLVIRGVIDPGEAFREFGNSGVITVAALFIVAAGLRDTGILDWLGNKVLGGARDDRQAMVRLGLATTSLSAFLDDTPIVAMFMPPVLDWCRKSRVSASRLLIPLSFFTLLGGTCTLIGTSTNLVVHGLMVEKHRSFEEEWNDHGKVASLVERGGAESGTDQKATSETDQKADPQTVPSRQEAFIHDIRGIGLFELSLLGVPLAVVGCGFLFLFSRRLLPDRKELIEQLGESRREYLVEMAVEPACRLVGQNLEQAGLRRLPGLFLIEIERNGDTISPVSPDEVIRENDRLTFTGIVGTIVELESIPGLVPAADPSYASAPRDQRRRLMCEAVVSSTSPLVGKSVREADFRAQYNAAIVAVHRNGARLGNKIGDIVLQPGDTLLLQTTPHFARAHRNSTDFYLVSHVAEWRPLRRDRAWISLILFAVLLAAMTVGFIEVHVAAALAAVLMVVLGCISAGDARESIEWQSIITIGAAFAMGLGLERSGAAAAIAGGIVEMTQPLGNLATLAAIYLMTALLTQVITNNAAAALMFPFCWQTAWQLGASPRPFLMALVIAASASFATPIGYQTNMMVFGPGGYRFGDYARLGAPLSVLVVLVGVPLILATWPL